MEVRIHRNSSKNMLHAWSGELTGHARPSSFPSTAKVQVEAKSRAIKILSNYDILGTSTSISVFCYEVLRCRPSRARRMWNLPLSKDRRRWPSPGSCYHTIFATCSDVCNHVVHLDSVTLLLGKI